MRLLILVLLASLSLAACASFPEVDRAERLRGGAGATPKLIPLAQVLQEAEPGRATQESSDSLNARAARLRARANAVR